MIIDLNNETNINEISELQLSGHNIGKNCKIEFTFSKEALIGFATNLIWTYEEINNKKMIHFHIDPLEGESSGNQALGFFLTPQSPYLVVQVNGIHHIFSEIDKYKQCKSISIRQGVCKKYEIKDPACDESIEQYELGLRNVASIKVLNQDYKDITSKCVQIVLKINYDTLKQFATMLLVLANNYSYKCEYLLANLKQERLQFNMGIIFTKESPEMVIKCHDLGCVYDYDPNFGMIK